ncbi:MAG: efflux transporter outer membrane subunit [Candidatus Contendobacter sp.]|nr:efflux transporter outer membrane subunit [Gammaproteobacteria bacterium]MCC8992275.1 efflux transporter outer membrane subunit [Candidatus Contendobacter sp.]
MIGNLPVKDVGFAAMALGLALLAGCTVGPNFAPPDPPAIDRYTPEPQPAMTVATAGSSGAAQRLNPVMDIPAQWWMLFQSPELDRLVRQALANSPSLVQAGARLKQAQEEVNTRSGQTTYPNVSASISAQREQVDLAAFGVPFPSPPPFNLLNGSVTVSYALDLFGSNRRLIESLNAQAEYEHWQLQAARLTLAGNVISAAIRQAQLRAQIDLTGQLLALQQQELAIIEQRIQAGGLPRYQSNQQRTLVEQTRAAIPPLQQQFEVVNHQLAVLIGATPAEATIESISLDRLHLPQELPVSLPSVLARQRPDIRAAEALLHQASANVGVATANLYPQIVLSGNVGGAGTSFSNGGRVWDFGAALAQPLFSGGSLRAQERKAVAAYEEAGAAYQQVVLQAFQQVADTLRALINDAQTLQARAAAAAQAEATYKVFSQRYRAGGISQLSLLDAQRQYLQTAIDRANSAANRYTDSAALFQALGGGWWNESPANAQETALLPTAR